MFRVDLRRANGHVEIVSLLMEKNANPAATTRMHGSEVDLTPLHLAIQSGHIHIVQKLVEHVVWLPFSRRCPL